jgi:cytochrome d ubiquinol oxidase subunit I
MDPILLARLQFAVTTVYHFFFVPLTLGLSVLVAVMQTRWVLTGDDVYRRMTRFWGKLFLINFATGVVTGIVQEFQFGMNWSEYSRFVGDVFGVPLALEALLAFFVESTFLGVWIFGWDRLGKRTHLAAIWLVAVASNLSALWILVANSFMQHPVGYAVRDGRAEMTDFGALLLNPSFLNQFPHVLLSGLATAAFLIMGISAYHLLRRSEVDLFTRSFRLGAVTGLVAAVLVAGTGHGQVKSVIKTQPMKVASMEALWDSEDPASLSLFTVADLSGRQEVFSIRVPGVVSLLAYGNMRGEVKGMRPLQAEMEAKHGPGNYVPPPFVTYWSFRAMVGAGTVMVLLAFLALLALRREEWRWRPLVLKALVWGMALPYLANATGWILAEVGRFPWVVYDVFRIEQGVSPNVTTWMLATTLLGYTLLYGLLMVATVYLLRKYAQAGPAATDHHAPESPA